MDVVIKTILGRTVVYSEEKIRAERRSDWCNGAPGGTKRSWNSRRKPKNRETARQLRNRSSEAKRQSSNASIHPPYVCSEGI